jgi:imidazolonepropionase-like amidohydrolase
MSGLLLRADALLDGADRLVNPRVLITDETITAVREHEDPAHGPQTLVVDLPGTTLLPGMIDSHVHATLRGGMSPPDGEDLRDVATENLGVAAQAGITTVRDCGSPARTMIRLRDAATTGLPLCLVAGPALTPPGGHAHSFGREVAGMAGLTKSVHDLAKAGVDWIKIIGCGGGTPGTDPLISTYTVAELRAVNETARGHGLPVTVHALNAETVALGLDAGVRNFEHGWLYQHDAPSAAGSLLERLAGAGVVVCPTIWATAHRVPLLRRRLRESPSDGQARAELDLAQRRTDAVVRSVHDCHLAGVRLIAGTDAGWRDVGFGDLVDELLLLERCGLSPSEALACATRTAADALGLGARVGRIAPGRLANIIAVAGDPSVELEALRRVQLTVMRGRPLKKPG